MHVEGFVARSQKLKQTGSMWACCCAADATEDAGLVTARALSPSAARDENVENVETQIQPTIEVIPPGVHGVPKSAAFGSFQVVVSTEGFSTLGLELDMTDPTTPMISEIREGAIQKFNQVFEASSLRPYDALVTLDEARKWEEIEKKMKGLNGQLPQKMTLGLKRPRKVQVTLEKTGPMGMKLDYKNHSVGAVVKDLDPNGLLATWNSKNVSDAIGPGDRIVEFDGQTCLGGELMEQMKTQSTMKLTVLKYWERRKVHRLWASHSHSGAYCCKEIRENFQCECLSLFSCHSRGIMSYTSFLPNS